MTNNLKINGRTAIHQESNGTASGISVNWTRIGNSTVPIPYPVVSKSEDCDHTAASVKVNGNPLCHIGSIFTKCIGDEPGQKKGLISGTQGGKSTFLTGSSNVYIEGRPAVRAFDMMTLNNGNTAPVPLLQNTDTHPPVQAPELPASLTPPEQSHQIGIRPFGRFFESLILQHTQDDTLQYLGNPLHTESDAEQGMPTHLRTTENLAEGDYLSWLCSLDTEGASQYTDAHCASLPILQAKSGWIMTPIPALLSTSPMGENAEPGVDLVPIVPACVNDTNTVTPLDNGWLYLFINGHLWRELEISPVTEHASTFRDVNLITEQGQNTRAATGNAQDSVIWVPKLINGTATDLRIAHSNEQWSWDTIRRLGGMDPENDPRFMDDIHNATALAEPDPDTPAFLIPDPAIRLTPLNLADYDAEQPVERPEPLDDDTIDPPTPQDFPTIMPLESSGLSGAIFTDAERLANNPQLPVVIVPNPLQTALQLAAQYKIAWGLFNQIIALYTDPAAAEALAEAGIELSNNDKDTIVNDAYRFQSARLLHQLFVQQPETLEKPTGDAKQDQHNQETLEKLNRWKHGLHSHHVAALERSLKKFEISDLKANVMRCRRRLIDFITAHRAGIDVFFLDLAARQDERGYLTRFETASLLFGQLTDSVQNWEHTVFGEDHPLNGEADDNTDGIALYRQLMAPDTLYSHSLTVLPQPGSNALRTHTGRENAVPDGIGGFDGNRVRHWIANADLIAEPGSMASVWEATLKIIYAFVAEGAKLFSQTTREQKHQEALALRQSLQQRADYLHQLQQQISDRTHTRYSDQHNIEELRMSAQSALQRANLRIASLLRDGDDLITILARTQQLRDDARAHYLHYAEQVNRQQNIVQKNKDIVRIAARSLSEANAGLDAAVAQLNQGRQQLLSEREQQLQQQRQAQRQVQQAQTDMDAARTHLAEQKAELHRLQTSASEHTAFSYQVQAQTLQRKINWFEQEDYRLARKTLTEARLAVKKLQSQLDTNQEQLALYGADAHGEPASADQISAAQAVAKTTTQADEFQFRLARTAAVAGSPIISQPVFAFETIGANTRPGSHTPLVSAQTARLTELGVLPKLASLPRLNKQVRDVAAMLYLYDQQGRILSHLKADLKQTFDAILLLDKISADALARTASMASFNRLYQTYGDQLTQYSGALENAVETLDQQMKLNTAQRRVITIQEFHTRFDEILQNEASKLSGLTAERNAQWKQWAIAIHNEHALRDAHTLTELNTNLDLQASIETLRSAEEAIGLNNTPIYTDAELKQRVHGYVQQHLTYLQRNGESTIPFKARWQTFTTGNALSLSFLKVLGVFQVRTLWKAGEKAFNEKNIISRVELFGAFTDSISIIAQIVEKIRLGRVGETNPVLRTYAAELAQDFLRRQLTTETLEKLPNYLKTVIHSRQAATFNKLLIRSVLISSTVNIFGAIGGGIRGLVSTTKAWQSWRSGEVQVASGYALMALGATLQTSSSISALRLELMGARATRFILMTSTPFALIAGIAIEMIGLLMTLFGTDGIVDFLSRTTWGTAPYRDKKRWKTDAAAEWVDLLNLLQNAPQAAAQPDFVRCDQPLKSFEVMLPGFTDTSVANLTIEHHLASWQLPSAVPDKMQVRTQTVALYHSPGSDLGTRLTRQLPGEEAGNPNSLPYQVITRQTREGLHLTFRFNHYYFSTVSQPFTLHSIHLKIACYPYGQACIVGRHQTTFANPLQPEPEAESNEPKPNEVTRSLHTLVGGVVEGECGESAARYWVPHWQQEGQKYLNEHQRQTADHERSDWQNTTTGHAERSIAGYLGDAPSFRTSTLWKG